MELSARVKVHINLITAITLSVLNETYVVPQDSATGDVMQLVKIIVPIFIKYVCTHFI